MSKGARFFLVIFSLLALIAAAAFLYIGAMTLTGTSLDAVLARFIKEYVAIAAIALGALLLIFSVAFMFMRAPKEPQQLASVLLKHTDNGVIRVSVTALDALVHKCVRGFGPVKDCKTQVVNNEDNVAIRVKVTLLPDTMIPDLTQQLQKEIKDYVQGQSGISVSEVTVFVDAPPPPTTAARVE